MIHQLKGCKFKRPAMSHFRVMPGSCNSFTLLAGMWNGLKAIFGQLGSFLKLFYNLNNHKQANKERKQIHIIDYHWAIKKKLNYWKYTHNNMAEFQIYFTMGKKQYFWFHSMVAEKDKNDLKWYKVITGYINLETVGRSWVTMEYKEWGDSIPHPDSEGSKIGICIC